MWRPRSRSVLHLPPELRPLVPALWQVKLGVERRFGITLGEWRTEAEAAAELQMLGFEGGNA